MNSALPSFDSSILVSLITEKMPFGKYKNHPIYKLPMFYLEWFKRTNGFPKGKLGIMLETIYEIKLNGLEFLLDPLIKKIKS